MGQCGGSLPFLQKKRPLGHTYKHVCPIDYPSLLQHVFLLFSTSSTQPKTCPGPGIIKADSPVLDHVMLWWYMTLMYLDHVTLWFMYLDHVTLWWYMTHMYLDHVTLWWYMTFGHRCSKSRFQFKATSRIGRLAERWINESECSCCYMTTPITTLCTMFRESMHQISFACLCILLIMLPCPCIM